MANFVFANNIKTTVASAFSNVATSLTLASSVGLPTLSAGQVLPITLNDAATGLVYEICYATAITGATLTVTRAQEGTAAQNWSVGDRAYCAPTALSVAPVNGNGLNVFQVANAVTTNEAVNLGQAQTLNTTGNAATATNATDATNAINLTGFGTVSSTTTGGAGLSPNQVAFGATGVTPTLTDSSTKLITSAFANPGSSHALYGYHILPGGLILQWGNHTIVTGDPNAFNLTFPIAFPVACLNANAIVSVNGCNVTGFTTTYISLNVSGASTIYWIALGY